MFFWVYCYDKVIRELRSCFLFLRSLELKIDILGIRGCSRGCSSGFSRFYFFLEK